MRACIIIEKNVQWWCPCREVTDITLILQAYNTVILLIIPMSTRDLNSTLHSATSSKGTSSGPNYKENFDLYLMEQ